jgi:hypothetical protein
MTKQQDWQIAYHLECITLTRSSSGGAFQLSSAIKKESTVSDEDLEWCILQIQRRTLEASRIECGDFSGFTLSYIEDGVPCRRWFLKAGSVLLRVSYNGPVVEKDKELEQVEHMLNTLRLESSNA